jgi:hypothetical protein
MYAFPTLLCIFYSFCIALHSQLYFVFRREPKDADKGIYAMLKWYLILPILASGVICKLPTHASAEVHSDRPSGSTALSVGFYGYDAGSGRCWYASPPDDQSLPPRVHNWVLIRVITTFTGWCILAGVYLLIASATIAHVVFWKGMSDIGGHIGLRRNRRRHASEVSASDRSTPGKSWVGPPPTSSMDGSTMCEVTLDGVESGAEVPLSSSPVDVKRTGKEDFLEGLEEIYTEGPSADTRTAHDDDWGLPSFPPPPKVHLGPENPRHTLQLQDFGTSAATLTQTTYTLSGVVYLPSHQEGSTFRSSSHSQGRPRRVSRRTLRAMALRLIGYILLPTFCIIPRVITEFIVVCHPAGVVVIPAPVDGILDGLNGLIGLFNALLFFSDPVLLVVWTGLWANRSWAGLRQRTSRGSTAGSSRGRAAAVEESMDGPAVEESMDGPAVEESMDGPYQSSVQVVETSASDQVGRIPCPRLGRNDSSSQRSSNGNFEGTLVSTSQELDS